MAHLPLDDIEKGLTRGVVDMDETAELVANHEAIEHLHGVEVVVVPVTAAVCDEEEIVGAAWNSAAQNGVNVLHVANDVRGQVRQRSGKDVELTRGTALNARPFKRIQNDVGSRTSTRKDMVDAGKNLLLGFLIIMIGMRQLVDTQDELPVFLMGIDRAACGDFGLASDERGRKNVTP